MGKKLFLVIAIILILILIVGAFFYYALAQPNYEKPVINIDKTEIQTNPEFVLQEAHISYILAEIGAYKLHNPPLSPQTPKINIKVDDDWYGSEIKQGNIYTKTSSFQYPDLTIYTTSEELIQAIKADNVKEYITNSVSTGKTSLELGADYSDLFSKGYLSLYKELTGKSLTGSTIRIFTQG